TTLDPPQPPGQVPSIISGNSRLVFKLPTDVKKIPFEIQSLLNWSKLQLAVSQTAAVPNGGAAPPGLTIAAPGALETAIELPYRLIMSPTAKVGWSHSKTPVTHAGWTELWHTRMSRLVSSKGKTSLKDPSETNPISLRAIWSPDYMGQQPLLPLTDEVPFRAPMSRRDRDEIVKLTSGFNGYFVIDPATGQPSTYQPTPVKASRVFLSALGGWLSSTGRWNNLPHYYYYKLLNMRAQKIIAPIPRPLPGELINLDLSEWQHIATMGRDHYVKVVYEGFLYPFGHRAALVKISERKFVGSDVAPANSPVAYLRQHLYIVVREKDKTYVGAPYVHGGREMPFQNLVRIKTETTPDIDDPTTSAVPGSSASFWINQVGQPFPFHLISQDLASTQFNFLAGLIFVSFAETNLAAVQSAYSAPGSPRTCTLHAKNIAYADPTAGDTTLKTSQLFFDTQLVPAIPPNVAFIPKLDDTTAAQVSIPAIAEILGTSPLINVRLYDTYLNNATGLDAFAGVYAQIDNPPVVEFSADKAGGFATPKLTITAVSARKGLVAGDPGDAATGLILPSAFFADLSAKLFGAVPLQALIPVDPTTLKADASKNALEVKIHAVPNLKNAKQIITKVNWTPQLADYEDDPIKVSFNVDGGTSALTLHNTLTRSLDGSPPSVDIHGELTSFLISLFGVIGIKFDSLSFDSKNGAKTIVKAGLPKTHPIEFIGPLSFVQTLADILPPGIFGGKGPSITLTSTMIKVSYTLGLPPISIGMFSLENIAITTGLDLPYLDGKPAFEFAFAARNKPFLIVVECLGGGGFIHIVLNADGIQMVEGALEFGGHFAFSVGVASGGVHIMAGIYFKLSGTNSDLSGFVDIGGEVSVLGIISISIDLNLSLSFISSASGSKVQGRATLTISVHIIFFSLSVSISVERSFGSSSGDPRVHQLISANDWSEYAEAFA
ncbi:MAG: hypothetical protein WB439_05380, partial [Acidobacteriaceae bacterium]